MNETLHVVVRRNEDTPDCSQKQKIKTKGTKKEASYNTDNTTTIEQVTSAVKGIRVITIVSVT